MKKPIISSSPSLTRISYFRSRELSGTVSKMENFEHLLFLECSLLECPYFWDAPNSGMPLFWDAPIFGMPLVWDAPMFGMPLFLGCPYVWDAPIFGMPLFWDAPNFWDAPLQILGCPRYSPRYFGMPHPLILGCPPIFLGCPRYFGRPHPLILEGPPLYPDGLHVWQLGWCKISISPTFPPASIN